MIPRPSYTRFVDRLVSISYQGFSLVEMAIVLVIIGLITGSILKGQELIESARVTALISQIQEIKAATGIFMARYEALPGDFNQAKERIDPSLENGNGDGCITGPGLSGETLHFWQHLRAAGLLPTVSKVEGNPDFGKGLPATKFGGGITISWGDFDSNDHWLVIGGKNGNKGTAPLLTPQQAFSIDRKLGSGDASTTVRVTNGDGKNGECFTGGKYALSNKKPSCVVYVLL